MKPTSQSGVALVITLLMLSVITLLAVAFLGTTRRERSSVIVSSAQIDAKLMADAALNRAVAEEISFMQVSGSTYAYDLIVSTNQDGRTNINRPMNLNDIASAQFDARVPVYVTHATGATSVTTFPFWLDFNRNTVFEPPVNGTNLIAGDPEWNGVLENPLAPHSRTNLFVGRYAFIALPTGKSLDINYVGNYAKHLANNMPADGYYRNQGVGTWEFNLAAFFRELNSNNWNYANYQSNLNSSSGSGLTNDGFVSAHEIIRYRYGGTNNNLASFTNLYPLTGAGLFGSDNIDGYADGPLMTGMRLLSNESLATPFLADNPALPWPGAANPNVINDLQDLVDTKFRSRYPIFQDQLRSIMAPGTPGQFNSNTFYRMLAQMGAESTATPSLQGVRSLVSTNTEATAAAAAHGLATGDYVEIRGASLPEYNGIFPVRVLNGNRFQYDFAGTGGASAGGVITMRRVKINLNFDNVVRTNTFTGLASETNFLAWRPEDFFRVVSDRLIRMSITNDGGSPPKWFIGGYEVSPNISVTNISLYPTNEYSPSIHRLLQLAANLYDAATNTAAGTVMPTAGPGFPSVFQPIISKSAGSTLSVIGYQEVTNNLPVAHVLNRQIYDVAELATNGVSAGVYTDRILYGVPLVIGAKKGYPNFNEFAYLLAAQGLRKVEVVRQANTPDNKRTNVMFMLSISNQVGIEVWNSYSNSFPRATIMFAQVSNRFILTNDVYPNFSLTGGIDSNNFAGPGVPLAANFFGPTNFVFPFSVGSNMSALLPNSIYRVTGPNAPNGRFVAAPYNAETNTFEQVTSVEPSWFLNVSNRVFYALVDQAANRIVDFVAMSGFAFNTNLSAGFGEESPDSGPVQGINYAKLLWDTNRVGGPSVPTQGVAYQIAVSEFGGPEPKSPYDWNTFLYVRTNKDAARKGFSDFQTANNWPAEQLNRQAPYQAIGECGRVFTWQVNDPLVHYMVEDLLNPFAGPGSYSFERYPVWLNPSAFISALNSRGTASPKVVSLTDPNIGKQSGSMGRVNIRYKPWRDSNEQQAPGYALNQSTNNIAIQDPLVTRSDKWDFPEGKFGNIGWIGRVHRGTPWQTVYLKSRQVGDEEWRAWVGRKDLMPTNDWRLPDVLTAAIDPNSVRGLLSINQSNSAAWAAALVGVSVLDVNTNDVFVDFVGTNLFHITTNIQNFRRTLPSEVFTNISQLMAVPELTVASPFLDPNVTPTEVMMERIPQQVLSLLTVEEVPRITVYSWGQSLKPAPRSRVVAGGPNFQLCTNYQITGEVVTKTVLRIEGTTNTPRAVVESYNVLSNP